MAAPRGWASPAPDVSVLTWSTIWSRSRNCAGVAFGIDVLRWLVQPAAETALTASRRASRNRARGLISLQTYTRKPKFPSRAARAWAPKRFRWVQCGARYCRLPMGRLAEFEEGPRHR